VEPKQRLDWYCEFRECLVGAPAMRRPTLDSGSGKRPQESAIRNQQRSEAPRGAEATR
jgi:hypothetical protein